MKQCKSCLIYNPKYDEYRQLWDDVSDDVDVKKHFCQMYDENIDHDIVTDKKKCTFFVNKNI